jgi:hypothetical protein
MGATDPGFSIFGGGGRRPASLIIAMAHRGHPPPDSTLSIVRIASPRLTRPAIMFASKPPCAEERLSYSVAAPVESIASARR